jgi:hypothetical protein
MIHYAIWYLLPGMLVAALAMIAADKNSGKAASDTVFVMAVLSMIILWPLFVIYGVQLAFTPAKGKRP